MKFTPEQHVVLIFCGGNMSVEDLVRLNSLTLAKPE
jgi:hypothetical protein